MSTATDQSPATAANSGKKGDAMPLDLDSSNFTIHNCWTTTEKMPYPETVFYNKVSLPTKDYVTKHSLINVTGYYNKDFDEEHPEENRHKSIETLFQATNVVPLPKSVTITSQPQKMNKMENKAQKKTPFNTLADGPQRLINALDRRYRSLVLMGDYMLIGGVVTYPGCDPLYDAISDVNDFVRTAHESASLDKLPNKSVGFDMKVDEKNFSDLAVVYINRGPDVEPDSRFVVPQLCRVTVGYYMTTLQKRLEESQLSSDPVKKEQYTRLISGLIQSISAWLEEDSKKNTPDTVLLVYNYLVVTDNSINGSEVFNFVNGTTPERRADNMRYILGKKNQVVLNITFQAKERLLLDENEQPLPERSDAEYLADDALPTFTITCSCSVPIIPAQRFDVWKKSAEGQAAIEAAAASKKRSRGNSLAAATSPKGKSGGGDSKKAKNSKKKKADAEEENDEDDEEEEASAEGDDAEEEEEEEEEETPEQDKKKKKTAKSGKDNAQPTKEEIGSRGTASDTAKKVKSAIASKSKKAKKIESDDDDNEAAQGSRSAETSNDDDNDAVAAAEAAKNAKKKKLPKKSDSATAADEEAAKSTSEAKRELAATGAMKADIKASAAEEEAPKANGKKSRKTKRVEETEDVDAMAKDEPQPQETVQPAAKKSKSAAAATSSAASKFTVTTLLTDDSASSDINYLMMRRKTLEVVAAYQQTIAELPIEERWGAKLTAAKDNFSADEPNLPIELDDTISAAISVLAFVGLEVVAVDAHERLTTIDQENDAAEAANAAAREAEEKKQKEEAAKEAKRKAAEEAKRKAAEEAAKRKAEEEAEAKRKAAEEAAKRKAAEEEAKRAAKQAAEEKEKDEKRKLAADAAAARQTTEKPVAVTREPGESLAAFMARVKAAKK